MNSPNNQDPKHNKGSLDSEIEALMHATVVNYLMFAHDPDKFNSESYEENQAHLIDQFKELKAKSGKDS